MAHRGRLSRALLMMLLILGGGNPAVAGEKADEITVADLQGLWRIAYGAPMLEGELSSGYLMIMPDGQYYEIRDDCCDGPTLMDSPSTFRIVGNQVIFMRRSAAVNRVIEHTRTFHRDATVRFYDESTGTFSAAVTTFALTVGEKRDFHYSWAKVYPRPVAPSRR